jgi:hypothetical protein
VRRGDAWRIRLILDKRMNFSIAQTAAWAPDLTTPAAWLAWAKSPYLPNVDGTPDVPEIPAMQRRRMNRLSRMAYVVTQAIENSAHLPQIFCARHGDLDRTVKLLQQLATHEPLSSSNFALSVHNAVAGGVSILQNNTQPITSLAAGQNRIGAAMIEALNHLVEYEQVVLVVYDDMMPEMYHALNQPRHAPYAFALKITRGNQYALNWQTAHQTDTNAPLPNDLAFLAFVLNQQSALNYVVDGVEWQWSHLS